MIHEHVNLCRQCWRLKETNGRMRRRMRKILTEIVLALVLLLVISLPLYNDAM